MATKTYLNQDITSKQPSYLREHPFLSVFLALFVVFVVGSIVWYGYQILFPAPPAASLQWNGVTAGSTTISQVETKLGQPLSQTQQGENQILSYQSSYKAFPHQVITKNNVVVFIYEWVPPDSTSILQDYITKFGQPDFIAHTKESGGGYSLNVFLKQGVAVDAHTESGKVFHVWYFVPTTQEQFMTTFQSYLQTEQTGP